MMRPADLAEDELERVESDGVGHLVARDEAGQHRDDRRLGDRVGRVEGEEHDDQVDLAGEARERDDGQARCEHARHDVRDDDDLPAVEPVGRRRRRRWRTGRSAGSRRSSGGRPRARSRSAGRRRSSRPRPGATTPGSRRSRPPSRPRTARWRNGPRRLERVASGPGGRAGLCLGSSGRSVLDNPGRDAYILAVPPGPDASPFDTVLRAGRDPHEPGDRARCPATRSGSAAGRSSRSGSWAELRAGVGPGRACSMPAAGSSLRRSSTATPTSTGAPSSATASSTSRRSPPAGIDDVARACPGAGPRPTPAGDVDPGRLAVAEPPARGPLPGSARARPRGAGPPGRPARHRQARRRGQLARPSPPPASTGRTRRPAGRPDRARRRRRADRHPARDGQAPPRPVAIGRPWCRPLRAAERQAALRAAYRDLHAAGIATIHEIVRLPEEADDHAALRAAGELGVRVRLFYRVHESPLSLDWLERLGIRRGLGDDWLKVLGVKVSVDGFCIFRNAAVDEPYRGEPDNLRPAPDRRRRPSTTSSRGPTRTACRSALHAVGPRAVDLGPRRIRASGSAGRRTVSARARAISTSDADRLGRAQRPRRRVVRPARVPRRLSPRVGRRLRARAGSTGSCRSRRAQALGIADPVQQRLRRARRSTRSTPSASRSTRRAVTACGPGHPEALDVADAWRAFTTTPAEIAGEPRLGRIAVGGLADLIVVDGDPFAARTRTSRTGRPCDHGRRPPGP